MERLMSSIRDSALDGHTGEAGVASLVGAAESAPWELL
jgi:hypothetical protein